MNPFFALDTNAKELFNAKFYSEDDATNEAIRVAKEFGYEIKINLYRDGNSVHYATATPDGKVSYEFGKLSQIVASILVEEPDFPIPAEWSANAQIIAAVENGKKAQVKAALPPAKVDYTHHGKVDVTIEGVGEEEADYSMTITLSSGNVKVTKFLLNGVPDIISLRDFSTIPVTIKEAAITNPVQTKQFLETTAKQFAYQLSQYPPAYTKTEAKKFKLQLGLAR